MTSTVVENRMRYRFLAVWIIILTNDAYASARRRRKGRRRSIEPFSTKLQSTDKGTLRDRWVDILNSSYDASNAIRLETRDEEAFYYSAELLVDKLLTGMDTEKNVLAPKRQSVSPMHKFWDTVAVGSTGILAIFPFVMLFIEVLPSSFFASSISFLANKITSMHASLTPYLVPTIQTIRSSVKDQLIQAQSIISSFPYTIKHIRRVQLGPLAIKLIKKCIILEAWRHIWFRIYKISKRVWKGTRIGSAKAYTKLVPAWIRRGINSTFKSMVQAQVHGVVGGAIGGIYMSFMHNEMESVLSDLPIDESIQQVMDITVDGSVDLVGEQVLDAMESIVETIDDSTADAISEGLSAAAEVSLESVIDTISESADAVVDGLIDSTIE